MANLCIKTPSFAIQVLIFQLLVFRPRPTAHLNVFVNCKNAARSEAWKEWSSLSTLLSSRRWTLALVSTKGSLGQKKWCPFSMESATFSGSRWVQIDRKRVQKVLKVICPGSPGHGSMFLENTAGEKAQYMINKLLAYRQLKQPKSSGKLKVKTWQFLLHRAQEKARLEADPNKTLGDVTTVNLTIINGGVQTNVVPDKYVER